MGRNNNFGNFVFNAWKIQREMSKKFCEKLAKMATKAQSKRNYSSIPNMHQSAARVFLSTNNIQIEGESFIAKTKITKKDKLNP